MSSWFFGVTNNNQSNQEESDDVNKNKNVNSVWSSWTDTAKWQEFAVKTQQDALRLAEVTQKEALKLAEVGTRVATEKAAVLTKHALDTRDHYDPNDIGSSILYGLGIPTTTSSTTSVKATNGINKSRDVSINDIEFIYITENIISMPFPFDCSKKKCPNGMNDILDVSSYIEKHHKEHYMILNISEEPYDYTLFNNQVLGKFIYKYIYMNSMFN